MNVPDDLILNAADEVAIRQHLLLVAMGKQPADSVIEVGRLLAVHANHWLEDQEIVISGRRIAYVGPIGSFRGKVTGARVKYPRLSAVPGLGEVHKHIESSHLTPEFEAAMVLPRGNTWTCEASHEFGNVNGARNTEFWQKARLAGSPLKIFVQPGSAVPPSAWEESGGYYSYDEQKGFLGDLSVTGLDEVMDWPSVWDPTNPGYARMWGMIRATFEMRGVVEGHGSGLTDPHDISAFVAAGLSSDHEVWALDEAWDRLMRGLFTELRPFSYDAILPGLIQRGLKDWSNIAFTTDDRSAVDTLKDGATDHNVRLAIHYGVSPEIAIQCATINPARHMRIEQWVGSITPGRYADLVLLDDVDRFSIAHVYSDGILCSDGKRFIGPAPKLDWPAWATKTMNVGRTLTAADFAIRGEPGRKTMTAAVLRPFHWNEEFLTEELPVVDGLVQRDPARLITKWSLIDRYRGDGAVSAMFWTGCGPQDPDTALACSVAHDSHNIWCIGSSDAAMATAVNRLQDIDGGWVLVHRGAVVAEVPLEVAGLMTARVAEDFDADMHAFLTRANQVTWMYQPAAMNRWKPGFPEFLIFATLTCSPWRWVLVAPSAMAPNGFVNVQTGQSHPIVW